MSGYTTCPCGDCKYADLAVCGSCKQLIMLCPGGNMSGELPGECAFQGYVHVLAPQSHFCGSRPREWCMG